ncbi:MAG: ammonium transporter [Deltaproteobacteria bacterium]|jgi:Amt family ammonium transporter|nr:ammonium transporter [Deltaproteobacteria bacterium]
MSPVDCAFVIVCAMLVMLMTPALGLFYGGLVRSRNVLSTTMHSFSLLGLVSMLWAALGFSLAFGPDVSGIIGDLSHVFLSGVDAEPSPYAQGIPSVLFMGFQCMFAVLTVALVSGAYAERIHFPAMLLFSALWLLIVYAPMAHWVWGGGWLSNLGALDFAGGTVVHMTSGAGALAAAHVLGPRLELRGGGAPIAPHNLPMTILGGGLLWFGWFGFNSGSALSAGPLAAHALITTHMAAAAGIVGWLLVEWLYSGKPTTLGAASGALAGLVAITPGAGFVGILPAILIGLAGGMVCYAGVMLKSRLGYDDALDVVGIHGLGGTWGCLATGLFASTTVNGVDGLFYGNAGQMWPQFLSVVAAWGYGYVASRALLVFTDKLAGLRVKSEVELTGLDISEHNERAYQI